MEGFGHFWLKRQQSELTRKLLKNPSHTDENIANKMWQSDVAWRQGALGWCMDEVT